jgi:hypothetical protein
MSANGRVRVVVRPRKAPVGTALLSTPLFTSSGHLLGYQTNRITLYGRELDAEHQRAVEEARRISDLLGHEIEVVHSGKWGLLGRVLSSLGFDGFGRPSIEVSPACPACSSPSSSYSRAP